MVQRGATKNIRGADVAKRKKRLRLVTCLTATVFILLFGQTEVSSQTPEEVLKLGRQWLEDQPQPYREALDRYHRGSRGFNQLLWRQLKGTQDGQVNQESTLSKVLSKSLEQFNLSIRADAKALEVSEDILRCAYHLIRSDHWELPVDITVYRGSAKAGYPPTKGSIYGAFSTTISRGLATQNFGDGDGRNVHSICIPQGTQVMPVPPGAHGDEQELSLPPGGELVGVAGKERSWRVEKKRMAVSGDRLQIRKYSGFPLLEIPRVYDALKRTRPFEALRRMRQNMPRPTFRGQVGNAGSAFVGGYVGAWAEDHGYGGAAVGVGISADIIGAYLAQGLKGAGFSVSNVAVGFAVEAASKGLGANDMQVQGLSRLSAAGVALATGTFPAWVVSTVASDVSSFLYYHQTALSNGMSSSEFFGLVREGYWDYFEDLWDGLGDVGPAWYFPRHADGINAPYYT